MKSRITGRARWANASELGSEQLAARTSAAWDVRRTSAAPPGLTGTS